MKVRDVMTTEVLTTGPEASIRDIARILVEHGISGLPVCDLERRVLGVVSEADILLKEYEPDGRGRGPLYRLGLRSDATAAKARAETAAEAMTAPAITISSFRSVAEAARVMTEHGVNRLPVVKGDELVGIVTRADLVRAFTRSDEEIEHEIRRELLDRVLWLDPASFDVRVKRGRVTLAGELPTQSDSVLLERLVRRVPGVVALTSTLTWRLDDTGKRVVRAH